MQQHKQLEEPLLKGGVLGNTRCAEEYLLVGNWKCHGSVEHIQAFAEDLNAGVIPPNLQLVVAPPFVYLDRMKQILDPQKFEVAAQDCWTNEEGAYTGAVSAPMLRDLGVKWVIIGHSERRQLFGENDQLICRKAGHALDTGLHIIVCVGETEGQRTAGETAQALSAQLEGVAACIESWRHVVIAYEPVWAIGTGHAADAAAVQEALRFIRDWVDLHVRDDADCVRLLYGGSVNQKNCLELAGLPEVHGFLVGSASLQAGSFLAICTAMGEIVADAHNGTTPSLPHTSA